MKLTVNVISSDHAKMAMYDSQLYPWSIMWKILSFLQVLKVLFLILHICFPAVEMRKSLFVETPQLKICSWMNVNNYI